MLLSVGLAAGLCIGEGVARVFPSTFGDENFALAGAGNRPGCVRPSLTRGYEPIPGTCGTNAEGARDYAAGAQGVPVKVMVVGDSLSTFTLWPTTLAEAFSAGWARSVQLRTYGVPGYNTCQELSMFRERVAAFAPDVVLLQACANDVQGSPVLARSGGWTTYFSGNEAVEFPTWVLGSRLLTVGAMSFLPRVPLEGARSGREHTAGCLAGFRDEAPAIGAFLFPLFYPSDAPPALLDEMAMRELLAESGIPFLDLRPSFESAGPMVEHRDSPSDFIHPNREGERVAARAIATWWLEEFDEP